MSYCVHCGVKLEDSLENCPLCNTPVLDPNKKIETASTPPFSMEQGSLDVVKRKDLAILLSVVLVATSLSCGLLNIFAYSQTPWSLLIIGACIIIWVWAIPLVIYTKLSIYISLFLDGLSVAIYLFMISIVTPTEDWFFELALPITIIITFSALILAIVFRNISNALLSIALYFFLEVSFLCVCVELLIDRYLGNSPRLTWSGVVLTSCAIIAIALITIISKARLRNEVRRRLHF